MIVITANRKFCDAAGLNIRARFGLTCLVTSLGLDLVNLHISLFDFSALHAVHDVLVT